jgi:hypothetical protein
VPLPPVIDRIRQKHVPDDEIRAPFANGMSGDSAFRDLAAHFSQHQQTVALELVHLSLEHSFWAVAPKSQNFEDAVCAFLDYRLREDPGDVPARWARIGLGVMGRMSPDLMGPLWRPLLTEDPRNVRWVVESSLWIHANSGRDTTDDLRAALAVVRDQDLDRLCADADFRLAVAARTALGIREGLPVSKSWKRYGVNLM